MTAQLPPQGPQEPDEHLPGEAELAALYRQLPQSEPSAALDAAVLHAAAQAVAAGEQHPAPVIERRRSSREPGGWVHPKPGSAEGQNLSDPSRASHGRRKTGSRWLIALSSAATLVLAAGLAWHMRGMPSTVATPDAASYQAAVNSPAEVAPAAAAPPPPAAPAQLVTAQATDHLAEPVATLQQTPRMASAKTTAMKRHPATPFPPVEEASETAAAAPSPMREMTRAVQPVAEDYSSATPVAAANHAGRSEVSAAPMPMPAPAPPPQVEMSASVAAPMPAPAAPAPPMPVSAAPAIEKPTAVNPGDTPIQELGKIQQLFTQGHDDEARQRLNAFHRAHPQWELPAELDAQLHRP
jgi:hypothetical protein